MSNVQQNEQRKRKRRSFWEPDSEKIITWLDKQADLGTSLQLIIVDAMRKYGDGDVIKAHLSQREDGYSKTITQMPIQERSSNVTPINELKPTKEDFPSTVIESSKDNFNKKHEILVEDGEELVVDEPEFDIHQAMNPIEVEQENETEYDPIGIMMRDSGSKINDN
ncbi:hypothetical protein [Shouchella miscanthi]|uniref:Uncharacterized protein n=1 Tax=Shouchella miscanthi TaxID=2598861 RepID=A0ABU6NKG2_9BACI|nr:hypothetical protein [Shouchella miscanthi]